MEKFQYFYTGYASEMYEGKYSISNGKFYFKERKLYNSKSFNTLTGNIMKFGLKLPKWKFDDLSLKKRGYDK